MSGGKSRSPSVALPVKSHFSLGWGGSSLAEVVEEAVRLGLEAVALADVENLYGQIELHHRCAGAGVRPVTGVELRPGFRSPRRPGNRCPRLVLLARDRSGYASICRIVSARRCGGRAEAGSLFDASAVGGRPGGEGTGGLRLSAEVGGEISEDPLRLVEREPEGLFVLSDDLEVVQRLLHRGVVRREQLRLLLVRPSVRPDTDARLRGASDALGVPLVAGLDAVIARRAHWPSHLLGLAIQRSRPARQVRAAGAESPERHMRSPAALRQLFRDVPDAVTEAGRMVRDCVLDLRSAPPCPPELDLEEQEEPGERLRALCERALRCRAEAGEPAGAAYRERLEEELRVLERLGFAPTVLAVAEVGRLAARLGADTALRGSAVSSLVLHLLDVSPVDPLTENLCFERFLHPKRSSPPDIDLDVCSGRREDLIAAVFRRFGPERVALVSSLQCFRARTAVREGLAALEAPPELAEDLLDDLPPGPDPDRASLERLLRHRLPRSLRRAAPVLARLLGTPRHLSTHPGGVVIGGRPLEGRVPLERAPGGLRVTQYDVRSIPSTGLLKIDLLGNRCLTELRSTIEQLRLCTARDGPTRAGADALLRNGLRGIPLDDAPTLATLDRADTFGCFQFETPAVRAMLARVPIRRLSDARDVLALVRPGPASGEARRRFPEGGRGGAPPEAGRTSGTVRLLEGVLRETGSVLLYEEDVLRLIARATGVSLAEADELRTAIGRCDDRPRELARLRVHFLDRARRVGLPAGEAAAVWSELERFAAYSFSRAHASSYARLGYAAAYLRTHFPAEFGAALLEHHRGLYPQRAVCAAVQRWGVVVRPPCVNRSEELPRVEPESGSPEGRDAGPGAVRLGLGAVKGLSRDVRRALLETRRREGAFRSVGDLRRRIRLAPAELRALVLSGACDGLPPLDAGPCPRAHEALLEGEPPREGEAEGPDPPLLRAGPSERPGGSVPGAPVRHGAAGRRAALARVRNELRYLGMHPTVHPMAILRADAVAHGCSTTRAAAEAGDGRRVRVAVLASASRRLVARGGHPMQFLTLEDEEGVLEAVLLPEAWRRCGRWTRSGGPFLAEGLVRGGGPAAQLEVERILPFHHRRRPGGGQGARARSSTDHAGLR